MFQTRCYLRGYHKDAAIIALPKIIITIERQVSVNITEACVPKKCYMGKYIFLVITGLNKCPKKY